jgi:hypothetical protein
LSADRFITQPRASFCEANDSGMAVLGRLPILQVSGLLRRAADLLLTDRRVRSSRLGDYDPAGPSRAGSGSEMIPPSGAAPSTEFPRQPSHYPGQSHGGARAAPCVLPPPSNRNDRPSPPSASAAPEPSFEVENLRRGTQPKPKRAAGVNSATWCQAPQSTVAPPEILDPRGV